MKNLKGMMLKILRFIVFVGIGIFLFYLVYKDQPIDEVILALKKANYTWILISLLLSLLSHFSRALRWNIMIESLGYKSRISNLFLSIMVMYLANTAIPRSGEIARCGLIKKYDSIPLTKLLGTVVVERIFDFIVLLLMILVVLLTQFNVLSAFLLNNPGNGKRIGNIGNIDNLIILSVFTLMFFLTLIVFRTKLKNTLFFLKLRELFLNLIAGMSAIKNLQKKWQFIFHSFFIWIVYFLMIYITFRSFEFTRNLTVLAGLTTFVMASIGVIAPSPGGIGTWHFMVIETLVIYGINKNPDANAFAFAVHGSMTLFMIITGTVSLFLFPIVNKSRKMMKVPN